MTKPKKTAYGAQMVSCGGSAKGGVSLQSKVGSKCKGAVGTQRWGQIAKDIYVLGKVGAKRKRTAEAALMR